MGKRTSFIVFLFALISIFAFSIAHSQEMEYKEYKVIEGDTLWDISLKEIQDPFLWPKIWKENPEIENPDRIYPSQTIRIPLRLLQKEQPAEEVTTEEATKPEPTTETAKEEQPKIIERKIESVKKRYIADVDLMVSSGYITDYIGGEVKSLGKITGSPTGRTVLGRGDYIYIATDKPATPGEKFYIIHSTKVVKHPTTNKTLGYLIAVLGVAEVVGPEDGETKAKVIKSYNDNVAVGDLLDTYYDVEPIMEEDEPRKPDVNAVVVAMKGLRTWGGFPDVLFIDKGSTDGLEVGDVLKTTSVDTDVKSRMFGVIQIIGLKGSTATAIIKRSESIVRIGDKVSSLK